MGTKITVEARRINIKEDQLVVPWESWCVLTPGVGKSKWRTAVSHQTLKVTLQVRLVEISVGSWLRKLCHLFFETERYVISYFRPCGTFGLPHFSSGLYQLLQVFYSYF